MLRPLFRNRRDAGRRLAVALAPYRESRPIVLALPRGGVPVGFEVAKALAAPLDVLLVRKIGARAMRSWASARLSMVMTRSSS